MGIVARWVLVVPAALLICGCADSEEAVPSDAGNGQAGAIPECSDVWIEGEVLPANFPGCYSTPDGPIEGDVAIDCGDGKRLVNFRSQLWAVEGGKITAAGPDAACRQSLN